ncbi:MAG TPA: hypothetical protein VE575_08620 [Acidimicrobiales bacterium]|jgi:hypothetical protein|nr:hypothetical protein [Acidimicrobiales bacterium]
MAAEAIVFPPSVVASRLFDPVVERVGFPVLEPYVELVWLPVIGPSATWMLRRLDAWLPPAPGRVMIDVAELGQVLGLGGSVAANATVQRTMGRLVRFGLAEWSDQLRVRTVVPPLSSRRLARLPARVREAHEALIAVRQAA